jgi:hypothetical protein
MLKKILVTFDGSKTSEAILPEMAKLAGATPSFRPVPRAQAERSLAASPPRC